MKLKMSDLLAMSVVPPASVTKVSGMNNLYEHPLLKGVLLRKLASPDLAWGCNGAVFICTGTAKPLAEPFNYATGSLIGYVGKTWRELLSGVTDFAMFSKPRAYGFTTPVVSSSAEIGRTVNYPAQSQVMVTRNSFTRSPDMNKHHAIAAGGTFFDGQLTCANLTVMEIVTGADDGIFHTASDTPGNWSDNCGVTSPTVATGYLSTTVKLPAFRALVKRNEAVLRAEFPDEVHEDFDDIFDDYLATYQYGDAEPTICFWTDVKDGTFGIPHFHPKANGASASPPVVLGIQAGKVDSGGNAVNYDYQEWPGYLHEGNKTRVVGYFYLTRAFHQIAGMLDIIDVNALRRGQSPHLLGVVEDKLTLNALDVVVDPTPFVIKEVAKTSYDPDLNWNTLTTAAALDDYRMTAVPSRAWWRDYCRDQALQLKRFNLGTLSAIAYKFVDDFSQAVEDHARARVG